MFQLWMKACVLNNFHISLQLDPILIYLWISFYYHLQHPLIQHVCESDHGSHRQGHLEPSSKSARRRRSHLSLCHSQCRNGLVETECRAALVAEHGKCYELDLIILTTRRDKLGKKNCATQQTSNHISNCISLCHWTWPYSDGDSCLPGKYTAEATLWAAVSWLSVARPASWVCMIPEMPISMVRSQRAYMVYILHYNVR